MKSATKMYESSRLYVVARSNTAFEAACALCSPARTIPAAEAPAAAARVVACAPRRAGPATRARKPAPLDTTA